MYLFAGYLLVAALVTPLSPGESASPLLGLSLALPLAYALATFSAIGEARPSRLVAVALALLHAGVVLVAAAMVLALASPRFVPPWLRGLSLFSPPPNPLREISTASRSTSCIDSVTNAAAVCSRTLITRSSA